MPQAAARSSKRKVKPGRVPLRVEFPLAVWEQVSESRHAARHETRTQALLALVAAGLAALSKHAAAVPAPARPRKLIAFAGADKAEKTQV